MYVLLSASFFFAIPTLMLEPHSDVVWCWDFRRLHCLAHRQEEPGWLGSRWWPLAAYGLCR